MKEKKTYFNKVFFKSNEAMSELPDNSVDLIITSPPYWDIKDYSKTGGELGKEEKHSEINESDMGSVKDYQDYINKCLITWKECFRVLKPGCKFALNIPTVNRRGKMGAYSISYDMRKSILENTPFRFFNLIVWHKKSRPNPFSEGSWPFPGEIYTWFGLTEDVIIFFKPGEHPDEYDEEIWEKSQLTREELNEFINPVWYILPPRTRTSEHSAVMSLKIVENLVKMYSFVGNLVMDPFTGSGTTLKGAKILERNWVGYELYPFYKNVIEKNLGIKLENGKIQETVETMAKDKPESKEKIKDFMF